MGFLPVASGDGSDEGDAGLGGAVRTSGRGRPGRPPGSGDCRGVTGGLRRLPGRHRRAPATAGAAPPGIAPGNDATPGRSEEGLYAYRYLNASPATATTSTPTAPKMRRPGGKHVHWRNAGHAGITRTGGMPG